MRLSYHRVGETATVAEFLQAERETVGSSGAGYGVPLLVDDVRAWARGDHPHVDTVELYVIRDETGNTAGRISLHTSSELDAVLHNAQALPAKGRDTLRRGVHALYFGAADLRSDVHSAVISWLEDRARARGTSHVFGPITLLPNQLGGAVVEGFEHPAFFDTPYHGPELTDALNRQGFLPWYPARTWEVDVAAVPAARRRRPSSAEYAEAGVRRVRARRLGLRGSDGVVEKLRQGLNTAFAQLPYFTRISRKQMARQTAGLELLADPRLMILLEDVEGGLACFALVVPDPSDVLRSTAGALGLRQMPRLGAARWTPLRRRGGSMRDAVLIVQGTVPWWQGRGLLSLAARELYAELYDAGYRTLRSTAVGEDNPASAAVFERAGGHPLHRLAFFVKEVQSAGSTEDTDPGPAQPTAQQVEEWIQIAGRAPSAHNTQPWHPVPDIQDGLCHGIVLRVHRQRTMPAGDPHHRDLALSLGAWVESLSIASAAQGWQMTVGDVCGEGPSLQIPITWNHSVDTPTAHTVQEVMTRRVYRGRLTGGWTQLINAASEAGLTGLSTQDDAGHAADPGDTQLTSIDSVHGRALEVAAGRHLTASAELITELLEWLRLDPRHPDYHRDGLSAQCLLLPTPVHAIGPVLRSRTGARLTSPLSAVLARLTPATTAGVVERAASRAWTQSIHPRRAARAVDTLSRRFRGVPLGAVRGEPAPLVAVPDDDRGIPVTLWRHTTGDALTAAELLDCGRQLQRFWLALHRHGLAVAPHTEVLDADATREAVIELIAASRDAPEDMDSALQASSQHEGAIVPFAYFRVGVPDDVPPRSARLTSR